MFHSYQTPLINICVSFILLLGCREDELELILPNPDANLEEQKELLSGSLGYTSPSIKLLSTFKEQLIAYGSFTSIGGTQASRFASFDGTSWYAMGDGFEFGGTNEWGGPNYNIHDIQEFKGELYITGEFDAIGGVHSPNLARWDGENWKPVGGGIDYGNTDYVPGWMPIGGLSLTISNDELYIGGGSMDGKNTLVKWDGIQLTPVMEYPDLAASIDIINFQNTLYGSIQLIGTNTLARFDGNRWAPVRPQYEPEWKGMVVYQDKIYGKSGSWDGKQFESFNYPLVEVHSIKSIGDYLYIIGDNYMNIEGQPSPPQYYSVMRWDGMEWSLVYGGLEGEWLSTLEEFQGSIYLVVSGQSIVVLE